MTFINHMKTFFLNGDKRFFFLSRLGFFNRMPDKEYIEKIFAYKMGYKLNLSNPSTFNEKIQWLKLYDRNPQYTLMVDKYMVKEYIKEKIGEKYIIPTLGVYESVSDIDFSLLPKQFVLKCTHDSGGLVICRDKSLLDMKQTKKNLQKCMKTNYFFANREWPYKNVKPRVIAEKYMEDTYSPNLGLTDYKFFCFHGQPEFLYISRGLENHSTAHISFLTMNWEFASFHRSDYKPFDILPDKPKCLDEMISIAKKLSSDLPFLRVDLYEIEGNVYFSELTFSPCGGLLPFSPTSADYELGKKIHLHQ